MYNIMIYNTFILKENIYFLSINIYLSRIVRISVLELNIYVEK